MKWKTFQEWSDLGYQIIKGSKGVKTNKGFEFSERQVRFLGKRGPNYDFIGYNGVKSIFYADCFDC